MTHSKSFKTMLTIAMIAGVALAAPRPEKLELNNEIIPSGGFAVKNGETVGASFGGFHASASLADDGSASASAGGNGLGASSGYGAGGAGAGAGLFGTGVVSESGSATGFPAKPAVGGYGNGGKPAGGLSPPHQGGLGNGFFDKIFAIPINVLQSVNTYLNQKQQLQGHPGTPAQGPHNNNGGASVAASASVGEATYGGPVKAPEAHVGADYGHESAGAAGHGKHGAPMMIPITALRSVQNLLNG